jgi:hypothetical protein
LTEKGSCSERFSVFTEAVKPGPFDPTGEGNRSQTLQLMKLRLGANCPCIAP